MNKRIARKILHISRNYFKNPYPVVATWENLPIKAARYLKIKPIWLYKVKCERRHLKVNWSEMAYSALDSVLDIKPYECLIDSSI